MVLERGLVVGGHRGCAVIVHGPRGALASQLNAGVRQTWEKTPCGVHQDARGTRSRWPAWLATAVSARSSRKPGDGPHAHATSRIALLRARHSWASGEAVRAFNRAQCGAGSGAFLLGSGLPRHSGSLCTEAGTASCRWRLGSGYNAAEQGDEADEARLEAERGMVVGRHLGCAVIVHGPRGARASQLIAGVRRTRAAEGNGLRTQHRPG